MIEPAPRRAGVAPRRETDDRIGTATRWSGAAPGDFAADKENIECPVGMRC